MRQFFVCLEAVPCLSYITYLLRGGSMILMSMRWNPWCWYSARWIHILLCSLRWILYLSCVPRGRSWVLSEISISLEMLSIEALPFSWLTSLSWSNHLSSFIGSRNSLQMPRDSKPTHSTRWHSGPTSTSLFFFFFLHWSNLNSY